MLREYSSKSKNYYIRPSESSSCEFIITYLRYHLDARPATEHRAFQCRSRGRFWRMWQNRFQPQRRLAYL